MTNELRDLIAGQCVDLLNQNVDGFAEELSKCPEAKLTLAMSFKITLAGHKLYSDGGLAYSRKFSDDVQGVAELPDPTQPRLPMGPGADDPVITFQVEGKPPITAKQSVMKAALKVVNTRKSAADKST